MDDRLLVVKMIAYMEKNLTEPIGSQEVALRSGYSLNRLRQKFFNVTGDTPSGYLRKRRLTEAAKAILAGEKIVDVAVRYGYSSQDNFTTSFRSYFGVTPRELYVMDGKYKRFVSKLREVFSIMELTDLKQPPLNTTLIGCIKGASDYFDNDLSTAMLFGLTGHAFLINIHRDLCPSGPYVWKEDRFFELLRGTGIEKTAGHEFGRDSSQAEREAMEKQLKQYLNDGSLCMLDSLEHQLFSGYDEDGFLFLQPWNGKAFSEIAALTYGTWDQCLGKLHCVHFSILSKCQVQKDIVALAKSALQYALELYRNPERFQENGYRIGYGAYDCWIDAVGRGLGSEHGNWWNGMVWSECRSFAARFFSELCELLEAGQSKEICGELEDVYKVIAEKLGTAKEKELAAEEKTALLNQASQMERRAETGIEHLLKTM